MPSPEGSNERLESIEHFRNQIFVFDGQINPDLEKVSQQDELEERTRLFLANYADSTYSLSNVDSDDLTSVQRVLEKCLPHLKRLGYDAEIIAKFEGQLEEVNVALSKKAIESALGL